MVKLITLAKRKEGLTHEEFAEYWEKKHGPLVVKLLKHAKKYIQNHPVILPGGKELPFDGVAEIWFDSIEDQRATAAWYKTEEGKVLMNDEAKFMDRSKIVFIIAEEKVIL